MTKKFKILIPIAVVVFAISLVGGTWWVAKTLSSTTDETVALKREAEIRRKQFCRVLLSQHHDKVQRLENTTDYLHSSAGREPTAINLYIREVSLPQTRVELEKETDRIPPVCKRDRKDKNK